MIRRPILEVIGPSGEDLVSRWGAALLGVTVTDNAGHESDECVIKVAWTGVWASLPAKGAQYVVSAGWAGEGVSTLGVYTVQRWSRKGEPGDGEHIEIRCRAADFIDKMKSVGNRHYDEENGGGTAGAIFQSLAQDAGVEAVVDPEVAAVAIPYRLRWGQSAIDFATELADDVGAVVKPQAGKLVVTRRGAGASGSGLELPPIVIRYDANYAYEASDEPREDYQSVTAPYFDSELGRALLEAFESTSPSSVAGLVHPAPTKDEARRQASAASDAHARASATGSFEAPGDAAALAGAPVICEGFGEGIDEVDWRAATVTHEITPDVGWIMTVETEVKDKPKEASSDA